MRIEFRGWYAGATTQALAAKDCSFKYLSKLIKASSANEMRK
jgi:hypothetical protein